MVRRVDDERRRAGKRVGHTARRGSGARARGRGTGQDAAAAEKTHPGRLLPGRGARAVRGAHLPQAVGRHPDSVHVDTVAQDLPGSNAIDIDIDLI